MEHHKLSELPSSVQTEVTVLGAMLTDANAIAESVGRIRAEDFSLDSHQRIFRVIVEMARSNSAVDLITVMDALKKRRELDAIGGPAYLAFLTEGIPRNTNIDSYIRILRDKSMLRQMLGLFNDGIVKASDQQEEPQVIAELMIEHLRSMREAGLDNDFSSVADLFGTISEEEMFEKIATPNGIDLGFAQLHAATGGPQPGELWIVAGRPSMGKTAWMANAAQHCALSGNRTAVISAEMPSLSIVRRMLSSATRIDYQDLRGGNLRPQDKELVIERRRMLMSSYLFLDDKPKPTVSRLRSKCARLKRTQGLDILYVDQLSKLGRSDVYRKGMQGREIIGEQVEGLKELAQELGIPVILLAQLSREDKKGPHRPPQLSDLKDSGDIEEDADVVILLDRPEYYDRTDESLKGKGKQIIAKNREGETKTCHCLYQGRIMRWEDTAKIAAAQATMSLSDDDDYYTPPPSTGERSIF